LGKGVTFEGYTAAALTSAGASPHDQIHITIFCSVAVPVDVDLAVRCRVRSEARNRDIRQFSSQFQPLGQSVWPVKRWVPGKFYADDFIIDVPAGSAPAGFSISFECQPL
jgi:hypothetical protein